MNDQITAQEWFSTGTRVTYDPIAKKMMERAKNADVAGEIHVWKRVERDAAGNDQELWTTFLPGFPDGSFGWAKVTQQLSGTGMLPSIYVEYVGQGDSDKPSGYSYGTMERADLVEALWEAEGIQSTFVVIVVGPAAGDDRLSGIDGHDGSFLRIGGSKSRTSTGPVRLIWSVGSFGGGGLLVNLQTRNLP